MKIQISTMFQEIFSNLYIIEILLFNSDLKAPSMTASLFVVKAFSRGDEVVSLLLACKLGYR